ncbi:threonine aldolase [Amycolatopsis deserti]|uniref:Threonine aldolase n=1 Tax=Amycolatopsis deserti TaxID=185696 RepID=A0ABQ3JFD5_9PSEU|nr:beta-eliminating lyase-related protein [Amycolatopsis deserti]GHF25911.1 threonine aldolase [Amycolatopsis deserti]
MIALVDETKIKRTLASHGPVRRRPRAVLERWLARVGEDVSPAEPVASLEARIAALLGTPAALFFPSGTMAQQVALRVHAERSGRWTFAAHPYTHLDNWEDQGYAAVHGLRFRPVGDRNELMRLADLEAVGEPLAAVVWELPQRDLGGVLPSWDDLVAQVGFARSRGAAAHVDGARLWESQPFYGKDFAEIAGLFDSVYVSLYKGLQGVRGAVLAADQTLIAEAAVWRRRLGGAIPDAWPLAVAALEGLESLLPRMPEFHAHARALATAINRDGVAYAYPDPPQAGMFHVHLPAPKAAVERAAADLVADKGVQLFLRVRSSPDPRRCSFEVSVGENGMDFAAEEVVTLLHELLERAV